MLLEIGKVYETRNGLLARVEEFMGCFYAKMEDGRELIYLPNGQIYPDKNDPLDIIRLAA